MYKRLKKCSYINFFKRTYLKNGAAKSPRNSAEPQSGRHIKHVYCSIVPVQGQLNNVLCNISVILHLSVS
jgi:hypothetical protein